MNTSFIAIASSKGGVGKTTTAINLAASLNYFGRNVVLVDGNYSKPNVGLMLGITKVNSTLHHTLRGVEHIKEAIYVHPSGLQVIPGSIIYEELHQNHVQKIKDAILPLKGKVESVILDCGPGFSQEVVDVLDIADKVILVTTPDISSITDVLRTKRYCNTRGIEILGVVVTHTNNKEYEISLFDISTILEEKVIGEIPFDEAIRLSQFKKYPVLFISDKSKATIAYKKLAGNLIGEPYKPESDQGLFNYILMRLGFK